MLRNRTACKQAEAVLRAGHAELRALVAARTAQLRESEERFRRAADATQDAVVIIDANGCVTFWNRAARAILGYTDREVLGRKVHELISPPHSRGRRKELFERCSRGHRPGTVVELTARRKNGSEFAAQLVLSTFEVGGRWSALAILRDASVQKQLERKVAQSERLASVGILAAGIAHEINNPLGLILLNAENALERSADLAVTGTALQSIVENVRRCSGIVKSVLQFSREQAPDKEAADLGRVLRRSRDFTREYARRAGVEVAITFPPELPPLTANATELEQLFVNLLHNAIEASHRGGTVTVRVAARRRAIRVSVQDRGRGMSREEKEHAFDPFFTTLRHRGGTGLGLSTCHGIVTDLGGTIDIASHPGRGTTILVDLPARRPQARAARSP